MAKNTFHHLSHEKKERVLQVLKEEFESKPFHEVTVKAIVEKLGIARGSFYQYFDNLEDSYFTVLDQEITDIHTLFIQLFMEHDYDLEQTLAAYGQAVSTILFDPDTYHLYKNKYLYWTKDMESGWRAFRQACDGHYYESLSCDLPKEDMEKVHFIKAVIHSLVNRCFQEDWDKDRFLSMYRKNVTWIMKGVRF